jgi:hypothetical protein
LAQIVPVVSESLEAQIRNLLPSQRGFGEDLQASNVIVPIIDLTQTAEGTSVPEYQAQAIAFGSQTAFSINNATTVIANTAGFYRIFGVATIKADNATNENVGFSMSDGLSTKTIWDMQIRNTTNLDVSVMQFDFIVFLASGDSISGVSSAGTSYLKGSVRQIADVNGNPINPSGFTPQ